MPNRKFRDLPLYTGNTSGTYLILNNSSQTTTHKVTVETLFNGFSGTSINTGSFATTGSNVFKGNQVISGSLEITGTTTLGGNIVPKTARGATLGTLANPFADIFVSSGSINIAGIVGQPNTTLSNVSGNILISAGGMQLVGLGAFNAATGSFQFISGSMEQIGNYHQTGDYELLGNKIITGSLTVSGSQTLIGTQILRGDKIVTGSINISGSQNFIGTQILRGNKTITGSLYIQSGSLFPQNTGSSLVTYNQTTGQLAHANFTSVIPSLFNVGAFYDSTTQSGSANTSGSFRLNGNYNVNDGITITNNSQINIGRAGTYNIQISIQIVEGSGSANIFIWLKKNGSNVPNTGFSATLPSNQKLLTSFNLWDVASSNSDYYEIAYQSTSNNTTYVANAATGNIPAIPSIIVTVNQVK
jgi:hypothetical protein